MRTSNKNSSLTKISFLVMLFLAKPFVVSSLAQSPTPTPPLAYDVENTGANYPPPIWPSFDQLPIVRPLPDPFYWADGTGRDTTFASWEHRRNEIRAQIENYEIGPKPTKSDLTINAAYTPGANGGPGTLTVDILRLSNGRTLRLTSTIRLPAGTAPAAGWPAIIEMALAPGTGTPSNGIAGIDYIHDDVTQYAAGQQFSHAGDPYFLMYPEYDAGCDPAPPAPAPPPPCPLSGRQQVGQYSAWAWGVSRLIDGMEVATHQAVNPLPIDLTHLGVHGCSYAGKMALFAGAFDERVRATFAQENGGGGAPAWRVSNDIEPQGSVEKIDNTDGSWFMQSMKTTFAGDKVHSLPEDHHLLMAMVAPRALLETGNTDFTWLSNRSNYVSAKAVQRIYETFGIGDRFGFYIDGGHAHCGTLAAENPIIAAFWAKFLLDQDVPYDLHVFPQTDPFTTLDYQRWTWWWGHGNPRFPDEDTTPPVTQASTIPGPNNGWNNSDVVVTLNATDPDDSAASADVQQISISLSGAQTGSNVVQGNSARVTVSAEGTTTISYFATDSVGNQESPKGLTVNVDKTPPAITITTPSDGATYQANSSVASSYSCADSASGVASCSGPVASGANLDTTSLGTHQFTVQATDLAGNCSSLTYTYSVQPQAPNAVLTASPTSGSTPLTVNFSGSGSSDPNPGGVIISYFFTFGDGSAPVQQSSPAITHTYKKRGTYTAWLIVSDNYGAYSEAKSVTVKVK